MSTTPQFHSLRLQNLVSEQPRGPMRTLARLIMIIPRINTSPAYKVMLERPQTLVNFVHAQLALDAVVDGVELDHESQTDVEQLRAVIQSHLRRIGQEGKPEFARVMLFPYF